MMEGGGGKEGKQFLFPLLSSVNTRKRGKKVASNSLWEKGAAPAPRTGIGENRAGSAGADRVFVREGKRGGVRLVFPFQRKRRPKGIKNVSYLENRREGEKRKKNAHKSFAAVQAGGKN